MENVREQGSIACLKAFSQILLLCFQLIPFGSPLLCYYNNTFLFNLLTTITKGNSDRWEEEITMKNNTNAHFIHIKTYIKQNISNCQCQELILWLNNRQYWLEIGYISTFHLTLYCKAQFSRKKYILTFNYKYSCSLKYFWTTQYNCI